MYTMIKKILYQITPPFLWNILRLMKNKIIYFKSLNSNSTSEDFINYQIGKFTILIPPSHELPMCQRIHPNYSTNVGRIATHVVKEKYKDLTFIDIGANVGDTIAILRNKAEFPIMAIEGDSYFFSILEMNTKQFPNIHLVKSFVGEKDELIGGKLLSAEGSAHFEKNIKNKESRSVIKMDSLYSILSENTSFHNSKMVKIDTDGFDCKVIRGSKEWFSKIKPVIFFEYDPCHLGRQSDDGISIFPFLALMGYKDLIIYNNSGEYMISTNVENKILLQEIHEYYSGRNNYIYCDICAFSNEDSDLFQQIKSLEMEYFRAVRNFE